MTSNTLQCHLCQVVLADNESTIKQHISSRHLNYRPFDCNTCKEEDNSFQAATEEGMDAHIAISHNTTNSGYRVIKDEEKEAELKAAIVQCRRALTLQHSSVDTTKKIQQYSTETAIQPPVQSSSYDSVVKPLQRERIRPVNERNNRMQTTSKRKENGKPFKCDQCSYATAQKGNFDVHVRAHTGEKPFKCDQCSFASAHKSNLDRHVRTHTVKKPFKCDQCSFASAQKSSLDRHMRTHTVKEPFKCNQCRFVSAHKSSLDRHVRIHTGEKPFKCDQCSFASADKSNLDRHVRIHTGEKPFKCDQCSYATAVKGSFDVHVRTHTGEKPFKCDQCSYASALKGNLDKHMRTHSGEKTV